MVRTLVTLTSTIGPPLVNLWSLFLPRCRSRKLTLCTLQCSPPSAERSFEEDRLRRAFFAWRAWSALRTSWTRLLRNRREARAEWCYDVLRDVEEAERIHAYRRVWHLS